VNIYLIFVIMKIILLYKGNGSLETVSEDILTEEDIIEFSFIKVVTKFGAGEMIKLFDYFYNIDINDYSFHNLITSDNCISLYLSQSDYLKIKRDKKINNILNI